jgi:hypothetical protein
MIFTWSEVLPETVKSLSPVRQEMLSYSMSLPGRRRPAASHILKTWALTKVQFEEARERDGKMKNENRGREKKANSKGLPKI